MKVEYVIDSDNANYYAMHAPDGIYHAWGIVGDPGGFVPIVIHEKIWNKNSGQPIPSNVDYKKAYDEQVKRTCEVISECREDLAEMKASRASVTVRIQRDAGIILKQRRRDWEKAWESKTDKPLPLTRDGFDRAEVDGPRNPHAW